VFNQPFQRELIAVMADAGQIGNIQDYDESDMFPDVLNDRYSWDRIALRYEYKDISLDSLSLWVCLNGYD
jgi:hypothetical protein